MVVGGIPSERAGDERLAYRRLGADSSGELELSCDAFADGEPIPIEYTADGASRDPPLRWSGLPANAKCFVLIAEDPDAPTPEPFVHWIVTNIPTSVRTISQAIASGAEIGKSSMLRASWAGCAPPRGDTPHRYVFQLFAVDRELDLGAHPGRSAVLEALDDHVVDCALLTGTYRR